MRTLKVSQTEGFYSIEVSTTSQCDDVKCSCAGNSRVEKKSKAHLRWAGLIVDGV